VHDQQKSMALFTFGLQESNTVSNS